MANDGDDTEHSEEGDQEPRDRQIPDDGIADGRDESEEGQLDGVVGPVEGEEPRQGSRSAQGR